MSDLASLLAQLSSNNQQPAADPVLAAVKQARASIDALMLKLGQTIDAKVTGQLATGLTQLAAGKESFVLKLATPLPVGAAVTIKVNATPQGTPAVTVSMPNAAPQLAQPLPLPAAPAALVQAQMGGPAAPEVQHLPQAAQLPLSRPGAPAPAAPAANPVPTIPLPQAASSTPVPVAQPAIAASVVAAAASPQPQPQPPPSPAMGPPSQPVAEVASPRPIAAQPVPATRSPVLPGPGQPAAQVPVPVAPPVVQIVEARSVAPLQPQLPGVPASVPTPTSAVVAAAPVVPRATPVPVVPVSPMATTTQPPAAPLSATPLAAQPLPTPASPYPVQVLHVEPSIVAPQPPPAAAGAAAPVRPAAPPLNLADPAQAAARQDSAAPLLARLAAIVTAAAPSLPRPVLEVAQKLLANRVDLNRSTPDGKALEGAVLRAGVLLSPLTRQAPGDSRAALLALRSGLIGLLGDDATAPVTPASRPAPPIRGEPPRAPTPQPVLPDLSGDGQETARTLLGQTDATLSRLKLLQSASQPAVESRSDAATPRSELRVEVPVLLGAETGILQLLVERDGKQKRQQRERGWRMRFAMNFSETGEVGADIAMLGRSASVAIWAADSDIADALDAMLPELGPAIQRHGLELTSVRVRRGTPRPASPAPGQLLDSAR